MSKHVSGKPWVRLASIVAAVAFAWCVALPAACELSPVKERIEFLEERKIDPSAMFYTELECMDAILDRMNVR